MTKPITKLIWHQVATEEWQAGGSARYFSIMKDGDRYTTSICIDDIRRKTISADDSLDAAKAAADTYRNISR